MPEEFQILGMESFSYQYQKKMMNVDSAWCDFQRDKMLRGVAARFGEVTKTATSHRHSLFKVMPTMCIDLTRLASGKIHQKKDLFICHGCQLAS